LSYCSASSRSSLRPRTAALRWKRGDARSGFKENIERKHGLQIQASSGIFPRIGAGS
jgi:hypothetical protein